MDSTTVYSDFVRRWRAHGSLPAVSERDVLEFEEAASIKLPRAYVRFILLHGFPYTPRLLDAIVENDLSLHDIQNFEPLTSILDSTAAYEAAGMPAGFIAIANDCMGNLFLFSRPECDGREDSSIWFFDHDLDTVDRVAPSFVDLLSSYSDIEANGA